MGKYIDADKLIAEIERRMKCYDRDGCEPNDGKWVELVTMKHFIESNQQEQPEVDLGALVTEAFDKYGSVDRYSQLSVSFNRAELYSFIKKLARKEE